MPIQVPFHFLTYSVVSTPFVSSFAVVPSDRELRRIWSPSSWVLTPPQPAITESGAVPIGLLTVSAEAPNANKAFYSFSSLFSLCFLPRFPSMLK